MIKTGICSITFREFDAEGIAKLVKGAGLDAIEWGSDVHVKPGDIAAAGVARKATLDAGLEVSSYGSYYRVLDENQDQVFAPYLESTLALGTDTIRIWAGNQSSELASDDYRKTFIEKLRGDLDVAAEAGVRVALEFHGCTFTDSNAAAQKLFDEVNHPNLYIYWQPIYWLADQDYRIQGLEKLKDRVLNLHVFHWLFNPIAGSWGENIDRRPLEEGTTDWERYLSVPLPEGTHYALMEFVRDDSPEQFMQDAKALRRWVS